jgi:subtilase family serine protease
MGRFGAFVSAAGLLGVWLLIGGCSSARARPGAEVTGATQGSGLLPAAAAGHVAVCPSIRRPGAARCMSRIVVDASGKPLVTSAPSGYGPSDIQSAYELAGVATGAAPTVALVDAYDDGNAESDVATYRAYFGLPACTTANGCFQKVNQSGVAGSYPSSDPESEWPVEISLDLDAACPSCKIILVETNSDDLDDLGAGVNAAVQLGATVVSNSYGGSEDSTNAQSSLEYYDHPGVLVTASAGDGAYGVEFPASSQYVLAVGGTSLAKATTSRGWSETVWFTQAGEGTGSGCSAYTPKPTWQTDTGCAFKTNNDVSAVADPYTGIAVYDTAAGETGWTVIGGTSLASPLVASIFAVTGRAAAGPSFPYEHTADFWDVTSGSNGTCSPAYLCTAEVGYDGPTGIGTPNAGLMAGSGTGGGSTDAGSGGGTSHDAGGTSSSPPVVTLVSPSNGTTLTGNQSISLVADVTSSVGVADVVLEWVESSGTVAVDCASPPSGTTCTHTTAGQYTWSFAATTGTRSWYVVATDTAGDSTTSATNTLTLASASAETPTVTILAPALNTQYPPGGTVPVVVEATALDGVSQVWLTWSGPAGSTQLELSWLGGSEWGLNVPFSASAVAGPRTLTVTAYDPSDVAGSAVTTIRVE